MNGNIEAIFLDTGNTMRIIERDDALQYRARVKLAELIGAQESPNALYERLRERYDNFKKWVKETLTQPSIEEIWERWMLPDFPAERIVPMAEELTRLWHAQSGHRIARPDVKPTVIELHKRGYRLGIIANAISPTEIPEWLETYKLKQYFEAIVLSSTFGFRKPDPSIYLEAARLAGVEPARCAYVGDNPTRDIPGARQAGFRTVLILLEQATLKKDPPKDRYKPDGLISEFSALLNFFPPRD